MAVVPSVSESTDPAFIQLQTLGPLALLAISPAGDERTVSVAGKTLALLAYLGCAATRAAPRERLTELLWATSDTESALQSIRQTRSSLKRLIGREVVTVDGAMLTLAPWVRTDRDTFRRLIARDELLQAIALYRGPFCDRFAASGAEDFERWAGTERATLQSMCTEAIARLASVALTEARATDALRLASRLADVDPDDERRWRFKLEALCLRHDEFGARIAAAECEAWLSTEMQEPSRALRLLLDRASKALPAAEDGNSTDGHRLGLSPDLIGRETQFALLLAAWADAKVGRPRVVALVGAAGLGKSRLLRDVQERLFSSRARVIAIRALPADGDISFALVSRLASALSAMRGAAGLSSGSAAALVGLNPALAAHYPVPPAAELRTDPSLIYVEALDELLGSVAEEGPIAVLIDDLHWADAASALIVASLGERQMKSKFLLVLALRPRAVGGPRTPACATFVKLEPLSLAETEALLGSIARLTDAADDAWRDRLFTRTHGNPFLILESLRLAMDAGWLDIADGAWCVRDAHELSTMLGHHSVMADRLSSLSDADRSLALVLAVAGRPMPDVALSSDVAGSGITAAAQLRHLEQRDITASEHDGWVIAHDTLAEALIGVSTKEALRAARARAAGMLCQEGSAVGRHGALMLLAQNEEWQACADIVSELVAGDRLSRLASHVRARRMIEGLPGDVALERVRRRLPLRLRLPVHRIAVAAGIVAVASLAAIGALRSAGAANASARTELVLYGTDAGGATEAHSVELSEAHWNAAAPIDMAELPRVTAWPTGMVIASALRNDGVAAVERFYEDSGGVDVALWHPDGREERLTFAKGDDVPFSWSADGSALWIETSRWGVRGHRAIARIDMKTRNARRISSGGTMESSDASPASSPDGSRIAFVRNSFDIRPARLCLVDSDGAHERCATPPGRSVMGVRGWLDATRVLVTTDSSDLIRTEAYHTDSGALERLVTGGVCDVSPDAHWVACRSAHDDSLTIAAASRLQEKRLVVPSRSLRTVRFAWRSLGRDGVSSGSIAIAVPHSAIPVGTGTLLRANVLNERGERVVGVRLRWAVMDSTAGTISEDGVVVPSRAGTLTVRASAPGRPATETQIRAQLPAASVILHEAWDADYAARWRRFGTPLPMIVQEHGHSYFLNNGDGDQFSGVYTPRLAYARDGLWLEAMVSTPISATQWQSLMLFISGVDDMHAIGRWDHITGPMPKGLVGGCNFDYPAGEGYAARRHIRGADNASRELGYPVDSLSRGGWYRVLVQLMPDGRCGIAVDGVPVFLEGSDAVTDSALFMIQGNSYGTKILVGEVSAGRGVRGDVNWLRVDPLARRR